MLDQLQLMKKFIIGRFDNTRQIENEKNDRQRVSPFAIHVNTPLENIMDSIPEQFDTTKTFHVLEETYKWHPNQRNAMVRPLLLRFDKIEDGRITITSLAIPDDLDASSVRHDNPMLRFDYHELRRSKTFPLSPVYEFDKENFQFNIDITVSPNENMEVRLVETISENILHVHERVWKDGKLLFGYYETPIIYERK
ncbi:unnamed protein product [Agarophyton chilense]